MNWWRQLDGWVRFTVIYWGVAVVAALVFTVWWVATY